MSLAETLTHIGDVPASYIHRPRPVVPGPPLLAHGSVFKWYRVHPQGDPVPDELEADARAHATAFLERGTADPLYGMGFVVLHHSTEHDFLFIGSWRGHQEYWQSVFIRPVGSRGAWEPAPQGDISPMCCVWEMAPIWHERNAWVTYLESGRGLADRQRWLDDHLQAVL